MFQLRLKKRILSLRALKETLALTFLEMNPDPDKGVGPCPGLRVSLLILHSQVGLRPSLALRHLLPHAVPRGPDLWLRGE